MAYFVYSIVWLTYLALPIIAVGITIIASHRNGRSRPLRRLLRTCSTGAILGGAVAMLYVSVAGAMVPTSQLLMACYLGAATLCAVSGLNWILLQLVCWAFRLRRGDRARRRWARPIAGVLHAVVLMALGLPYLASVLLLYRPKAPMPGNPRTLIDAAYRVVHFPATDGIRLEGWWIPATKNTFTDGRGSTPWGRDTVLLCPGFGADKAADLFLARDLVANGYNVLAIDLRAHGHSGGQFTGFGGVEKRDVLGAVQWLRANQPTQCRRILGLGESLGAVALIEAAADPGPDGQAISAIAAYNPYASVPTLLNKIAQRHSLPAARWALRHLIVPVASAQIGSNLAAISPAAAAQSLWPRPILVLGNSMSRHVLQEGAYDLYQDALQPKYAYWSDDADRPALLHDDTAALTVRIFFDGERPLL